VGGARKRTGSWRSTARSGPGVSRALEQLGKRVLELRRSAGLSQEEAASRARLDPKHWQQIEHGLTNPTVASLVGVSRALGVSLADLFA
jgi:transcriptional regulator with XRE-family HTH domain